MADVWLPSAGKTDFEKEGRGKVEVTYTNQSNPKQIRTETFFTNEYTLEEFKARVQRKVEELAGTGDRQFKIAPGPIDTTPVSVELTPEQIARQAYNVAYRASAKAQQAVRDGVLPSDHSEVAKRAATAAGLFQPEYLD